MKRHLPIALLPLLVMACGEPEEGANGGEPLTLHFKAQVGDQPFACGTTYEGLGATNTHFEPFDFRLYVSAIELQSADGRWEPLQLEQDNPWQHENLALLDFEDASGACANGTTETRDIVEGYWDLDGVQVLRFEIGVPFEWNHIDASTAPSPLNQTALFWNWLGGYKFIRLEGATAGLDTGWQFHLGSTACQPGPGGGASSCDNENRVIVELSDFDPHRDQIVFDVAALVETADLDSHQENSPRGCMAGPDDGDCAALFEALGLPFQGDPGGTQRFVRLEPGE